VLAGFSTVPPVAETVANLRRGSALELSDTRHIRLAGFGGMAFDGQTTGARPTSSRSRPHPAVQPAAGQRI
jgi:hypothetical protein